MKFRIYDIKLKKFDEWFKKNNGISFLKISSANGVRGTVATRNVTKGENILVIPRKILIVSSDFGENNNLTEHDKLILLTYQYYKKNLFTNYFSTLPKQFNDFPLMWDMKKRKIIENTFLEKKFKINYENFNKKYEKLLNYIPNMNYNDFRYIWIIVNSRNFSVKIKNKKVNILAPYGDMLNHSFNKNTKWSYDDNLNAFVFKSTRNIIKNEIVTDSYGIKTSDRYLFYYGFFLPEHHVIEINNKKLRKNNKLKTLNSNEINLILEKLNLLLKDKKKYKNLGEEFKLQKLILQTEIEILEQYNKKIIKLNI